MNARKDAVKGRKEGKNEEMNDDAQRKSWKKREGKEKD